MCPACAPCVPCMCPMCLPMCPPVWPTHACVLGPMPSGPGDALDGACLQGPAPCPAVHPRVPQLELPPLPLPYRPRKRWMPPTSGPNASTPSCQSTCGAAIPSHGTPSHGPRQARAPLAAPHPVAMPPASQQGSRTQSWVKYSPLPAQYLAHARCFTEPGPYVASRRNKYVPGPNFRPPEHTLLESKCRPQTHAVWVDWFDCYCH